MFFFGPDVLLFIQLQYGWAPEHCGLSGPYRLLCAMPVDVWPLRAQSDSAPLSFVIAKLVGRTECHYLSVLQEVVTKTETEITIQA